METAADRELLANAGLLIARHAMVWVRRLNAPVDRVWELVSTQDGLSKWWLVPPKTFELKSGGVFEHHWINKVSDFEEHQYIDFAENTGDYASTGGMRFELSKLDDRATMFMFLDTWGPGMGPPPGSGEDGEQAGGPGSPWPGVAAGWHAMVDKLESVVDRREPPHTYEELTRFYVGHLRDLFRWNAMVQRGAKS